MSDSESTTHRTGANVGSDVRGANRRWRLAVVILALAGAGSVLLSTARSGAGVESWDSVWYFDVARNLASGRGFVFHTGEPLVWWPPLYPALIALVGFATKLDPAAFAHLVNSLLFALVICLSARLFRTGARHTATFGVLGVCAVLLSKPLSVLYATAWSEVLFIPLVLLYLVFAQRYWNDRSVFALAVMTLTAALACLTRYSGVALVAAGVVTIVLASAVSPRTRLVRASAFAALSLAPLGLWTLRNYRLTETFFGDRGPFHGALAGSVVAGARTILSWYVFGPVPKLLVPAWLAVLAVAFLSSRTARGRLGDGLRNVLSDQVPVVLFLLSFTAVLLAAATRDAVIDSRMLSPIYVPLTLVILRLGYGLFVPSRPPAGATPGKIPAILLALWLCYPFADLAGATAHRFRNGAGGYSTPKWRESATIAYARQVLRTADGVEVYSNGPDVLWELARVDAILTPHRTGGATDIEGRWPGDEGSLLVWFRNITWRPYLLSVEELTEVANVVEVAQFDDGTVYRVSPKRALPGEPRRQSGKPGKGLQKGRR